MKVLDPGHAYLVDVYDGDAPYSTVIQFMKREGKRYPGNKGHYAGTNCQELIRVLIDRIGYLNNQINHESNSEILYHQLSSLHLLEYRAAERHGRELPYPLLSVEHMPYCRRCGHIGCEDHKA